MRFLGPALLLSFLPAIAGTPAIVTENTVALFVDGSGDLPGIVWQSAKGTVSSIFGRIGVPVAWRGGLPPAAPVPDCIMIRLHLAGRWSWQTGVTGPVCSFPKALACSFPFGEGPATVIIMYGRLALVCRRPRLLPALLAHSIAHEIAHVLQRADLHSETGLMKKYWTAADFRQMEISPLEFTSADLRRIQEGFDRRRGAVD